MWRGPRPYFYLRPDEATLVKVGAAPGYAIVLALRMLLPLALVAFVLEFVFRPRFLTPYLAAIDVLLVALGGVFIVVAWRRQVTTEYAVTDERVYARRGRLVTYVHFTTHDKVTDFRFRQGPFERAVGIQGLTLATAGGDVAIAGVRDAVAFKQAAEDEDDSPPRATGEGADSASPQAADAHAETPVPPWHGPVPAYLKRGDTPVWMATPRPIAAVTGLRVLVGLAPMLLIPAVFERVRNPAFFVAVLGLGLIIYALRATALRQMEYVATGRRVYARRGFFGTTVNQLTYDKITDITYRQDIAGRIFGFGSVIVNSAGSNAAPITMEGLADPIGSKEIIERWRDVYMGEARR